MKPLLFDRASASRLHPGLVLAQDVREAGRIVLDKGAVLGEAGLHRLAGLPWSELHLVEMEPGDLHEEPAGGRLAAALAGPGVEVRPLTGGAWPLVAAQKGILEIDEPRLARINQVDDVVVYVLPQRVVVLEGELLGRAKIIPFVTAEERIARAEAIAAEARAAAPGAAAPGGVLRVRPFAPTRVAAVVMESLDAGQLARFRRAFEEKLAFFGSELISVQVVPASPEALAASLQGAVQGGAQLVAVAGSKPMDPLDPSLRALERAGATLEVRGVPAHPGTLLWLARLGEAQVVGMPSCGLFSKATVFDLLLPRLLAGERLARAELAALGAGGLLTRDMSFRFPAYSATRDRGELDAT